ncbi:hypothetical protein Ddc_02967 [Ditylenchus destructor]|nr:hypothetical protein Ddc_02967 [Ditylenchus destructor]
MLGKLVNKFKKQSLQDQIIQGSASPTEAVSVEDALGSPRKSPKIGSRTNSDQPVLRKSARLASHSISSSSSPQLCSKPEQKLKPSLKSTYAESGTGTIFDSGTESDDDELEQLDQMDSMSTTGKDHDGIFSFQAENDERNSPNVNVVGSSPPTLTSSPPLISEIDTSSWDSMGCESGIVLRESAERDDASRNIDLLDSGNSADSAFDISTPVQRKDGFPVNFGTEKQNMDLGSDENSPCGTPSQAMLTTFNTSRLPVDFSALRDQNILLERDTQKVSPFESNVNESVDSQKSSSTPISSMYKGTIARQTGDDNSGKSGAFRPVVRQRSAIHKTVSNGFISPQSGLLSPSVTAETSRNNTPSPNNLIGEKRRWGIGVVDSGSSGVRSLPSPPPFSPVASRTRGSMIANQQQLNNNSFGEEMPRAVLTARRTRVRVLYHHDNAQHQKAQHKPPHLLHLCEKQQSNFSESPPNNLVNKRGRHSVKSESSGGERPCLNFDKMRERMMGFNTIESSIDNVGN